MRSVHTHHPCSNTANKQKLTGSSPAEALTRLQCMSQAAPISLLAVLSQDPNRLTSSSLSGLSKAQQNPRPEMCLQCQRMSRTTKHTAAAAPAPPHQDINSALYMIISIQYTRSYMLKSNKAAKKKKLTSSSISGLHKLQHDSLPDMMTCLCCHIASEGYCNTCTLHAQQQQESKEEEAHQRQHQWLVQSPTSFAS